MVSYGNNITVAVETETGPRTIPAHVVHEGADSVGLQVDLLLEGLVVVEGGGTEQP